MVSRVQAEAAVPHFPHSPSSIDPRSDDREAHLPDRQGGDRAERACDFQKPDDLRLPE
jgi:hypothetical protein